MLELHISSFQSEGAEVEQHTYKHCHLSNQSWLLWLKYVEFWSSSLHFTVITNFHHHILPPLTNLTIDQRERERDQYMYTNYLGRVGLCIYEENSFIY